MSRLDAGFFVWGAGDAGKESGVMTPGSKAHRHAR
jgi:hypothetical protein